MEGKKKGRGEIWLQSPGSCSGNIVYILNLKMGALE